jgi:alpha-amylase
MKRSILFLLLLIIPLSACAPVAVEPTSTPIPAEPTSIPEKTDWWEGAIFYEIFVRSFYDSDGDGIGDFNGITEKLDYLEELGVNAIWLMPIHPSPSYHGYDVLNFYAVNHEYGTLDDFKHLLDEAHKRDMRIIIDLVLNHTSSQHPFFVDANNNPDSPYRDWYIWEADYPNWGGNLWHEGNQGVYYGLFWGGMPDLNYRNPAVTEQMEKVVRYWLDEVGVDGFRLDAIKHLIESGEITENTEATHAWLTDFYTNYKSENETTYMVGEVYGAGGFIASTYTRQLDHVFNFELASGFVNSANGGSNTGINSAFYFTLKDMPDGAYATFLTNHDQNRAMSVFYNKLGKAKVAASMLLTSPGTPFIYYGEEIGMLGQKPDEDIRLPMQWTAGENAGFTSGTPWRALHENFATVNVAAQDEDEASLLNYYRTLIALREEYPALRTGETEVLDPGTNALFVTLRTLGEEKILIIVSLTDEPVSGYHIEIVNKWNVLFPVNNQLNFKPASAIPPYETIILKLSN